MNSTTKNLLIAVLWVVCGIYNFGTTLAYFTNKFPTIAQEACRGNVVFSSVIAAAGPYGTLVSSFYSNFNEYGWQTTCDTNQKAAE